jgi:hypothetical protein
MCAMAGCDRRAASLAELRLGAQLRAVPVCTVHAARLRGR